MALRRQGLSIRECHKVLKQAGAISTPHMTLHRCFVRHRLNRHA
ncbi:hypothetical protein [Rhodomicrobium lacus]|nr:hypothetical protein [Rhodomicrobium lacus]